MKLKKILEYVSLKYIIINQYLENNDMQIF